MDTHTFSDAVAFWSIWWPIMGVFLGLIGWWVRGVNQKLNEVLAEIASLKTHTDYSMHRLEKLEQKV